MLRMFANGFQVFSGIFCKCFICMFRVFQLFGTYVASVSSGYFKSRSGVAASVSDACFMCSICLQTYVASVASECFKSRSGVASLSSLFCCLTFASVSPPPPPGASWASAALSPSSGCWRSHLLQFAGRVHASEKWRGREQGLPTCSRAGRAAHDAGARGETEGRRGRPGASTIEILDEFC